MSGQNLPKYLQPEEALSEECKKLMTTLPREQGYIPSSHFYLYQGFWYQHSNLQGTISCQKHFRPQDSDVILVTFPKCGTTWFKAVIFALLNRNQHPVHAENHPLLTTNPHNLVLNLEISLYADNQQAARSPPPPPRLMSSHMPLISLPHSTSKCKMVYVCRNPKDTFVSLWHFINKVMPQEMGEIEMGEFFERFSKGVVAYGPFWDHVIGYWKKSREDPERVLFLKYEDMKAEPIVQLYRLAEFLGCPFSKEEEECGMVQKILELISIDGMRSLEVNKSGILPLGLENRHFFRKGVVGDWENYLSHEMVEKLDGIMQEKLFGTGLVL